MVNKLVSVAVWLFFVLGFPSGLWAGSMGQLFSFGDSGIDTGNLYAMSGGLAPAEPYWNGRFSNGKNYLDFLAQAVPGWEADAWIQGGTNTAFGGALSGLGYVPLLDVPNASQQVVEFQAVYGQAYASVDMVLFSMGQNDLHADNGFPADPSTVADNMVQAIELAYQNGARRFVFPTLFPVGLMPEVAANPDITQTEAAAWADAVNAEANARFAQFLEACPDAVIIRTDLTARIRDIYANPAQYGLANVTESAYTGDYYGNGGSAAQDNDAYLWWDGVHVTTRVQELVAQWILLDVQDGFFPGQSSPGAGMGSILALTDQTFHRNREDAGRVFRYLAREGYPGARERPGSWYLTPFGVLGDQDGAGSASGWSWHHAGVFLGRETLLSGDAVAGFSLGGSRGKLELDNGYGEADTRLYQASLYGGIRKSPGFILWGGRYGYADNDAFRDMHLTGARALSRFHTHLFSGWVETGRAFGKAAATISPLAGLAYLRMINSAGGETGGGLLGYDTLDYASTHHLRHKLGVRASRMVFRDNDVKGRWTLEAAWQHEYLDNRSESTAALAGESYYFSSPSTSRDSLCLTGGLRLSGGERHSLDMAYQGAWADDAMSHSFNISVVVAY